MDKSEATAITKVLYLSVISRITDQNRTTIPFYTLFLVCPDHALLLWLSYINLYILQVSEN